MSSFFVDKKIYKERLDICRSCNYYFKPTGNCKRCGCFMKIKASIGSQYCPEKKWTKTNEVKKLDKIPKRFVKEAKDIWEDIKTGTAKDIETKKRAVELHNVIYGTGFRPTTNCSSCLRQVKDGIEKIKNET